MCWIKFAAPGQVYNNRHGLYAGINSITFPSGLKGFNYGEIVSNPPHAFGTGQILRMNNTVLIFDLQQNTQKAEFEYLDEGGTINFGARGGANIYIGTMYAMPANMIINGLKITKSNVRHIKNPQGVKVAEKGIITLTFSSDIGSMIIGGQEMYLDNFCFN